VEAVVSWLTRLRDAWAASAEPEGPPAATEAAEADEPGAWLIVTRRHSLSASLEAPPAVPDQRGAVKKRLFIFGPGWLDPNNPPK
jgi:hypothetical protein